MEIVSQIIERKLQCLPEGGLDLVNPRPDALFRSISSQGRHVRLSSNSFGDCSRLQAMGADAHFEAIPEPGTNTNHAVLVLPREKEKLAMLLHALGSRMQAGGKLWLAGENRAGIKSAPRQLNRFFGRVEKLDNARHCVLFEASEPVAAEPFDLAAYEDHWRLEHPGGGLDLVSLPGVFAHGRLDKGTALLLEALDGLRLSGRVLDFASGCGVIGLSLLRADPAIELTLLDDSALAIEAGNRSMLVNGLKARSLPSNGLSELEGRFDWIVSNPPFHRGVGNDLETAQAFFRGAGTFLAEKGKILVVFNRHLPYTGWMRESFRKVDCLAQNREFTVMQASK